MKPSQNTLDSLSDMKEVRTAGDVRRIGSQMLLALARKEISATDIDAASKMMTAQASLLAVELKAWSCANEMRKTGSSLTKEGQLGELDLIGPKK